MRAARAAVGAMLLLSAAAVRADTLYVSDQVQVGVHENNTLASTIVELVPSGTALEVVSRNGALVQVRTPAGTRGWVDARFLVEAQPGRARVQSLESELAGAQAALADAQARLVAMEQRAKNAQGEAPSKESIPSETLREMQSLAEENQRLKQQVAELEAVQRMARERAAASPSPGAAPAGSPPEAQEVQPPEPPLEGFLVRRWQTWQMLLLASVLLLAFSAGGWLVDWGIRRRHGGFRV